MPIPPGPMPRPARPTSPLTFADLVADLTWPKLLRAGPLALRPSRVLLGLAWLLGALAILFIADRVDDAPGNALKDGLARIGLAYHETIHHPRPEAYADLHEALLVTPTRMLVEHPVVTVIGLIALVAWTALFGGAIARSAACDFSLGRSISWTEALGFGLSKWRSLAGSILLPLVLLWSIAFALAVGGLLLRAAGLNLVAGIGWGLFLIGGLVAAAIMTTLAAGHTMLVPAVACEGTDAIDAVQHAYAYVYAKPLRLVLYTLLLIAQALVVVMLVAFVVLLTMRVAGWSAQGFAGDRGRATMAEVSRSFEAVPSLAKAGSSGELTDTDRYAAGAIKFWSAALFAIGIGAAVSIYWTSCTLLYLAMRRICDGQDVHELWSPGMVEGTLAQEAPMPAPPGAGSSGGADVADES